MHFVTWWKTARLSDIQVSSDIANGLLFAAMHLLWSRGEHQSAIRICVRPT